ncbi:MAG TPA: hypothetical protein VGQ76_10420 [Thermoanaerobaculia bacterium]|jgi:hypothetical protein|nr:hypothetical protein [Thermoanaerobaculia bacterium]
MNLIKPVVAGVVLMFCTLTAEVLVAPADKDPYDSGCIVDFSTAACFRYSDPTGYYVHRPGGHCVPGEAQQQLAMPLRRPYLLRQWPAEAVSRRRICRVQRRVIGPLDFTPGSSVFGKVELGGLPASDLLRTAEVPVRRMNVDPARATTRRYTATPDARGFFQVRVLAPGDYALSAHRAISRRREPSRSSHRRMRL